jgi:hypothetical membrane protein
MNLASTVARAGRGSSVQERRDPARSGRTQRALAWAGIAGPAVFTVSFLAQELYQGERYSRVSDPVSALAALPHGWVQSVSFAVFGVLTVLFAVGLHRAVRPARRGIAGPGLFVVSACGLALAAIFPLAQRPDGSIYDTGGHAVAGVTFFSTSALALLALAPRLAADERWRGLARYTRAAGVVALVGFVVTGALVVPENAPLHDVAGLVQRVLVLGVIFPGRVALSVRMLRLART